MIIFCDNNSTIKLSKNPVLHGRRNHIDVKFHFLRDFTKDETIEIICCERKDKVVDIFTKSLKLKWFVTLRKLFDVCTQENLI